MTFIAWFKSNDLNQPTLVSSSAAWFFLETSRQTQSCVNS